MRNQITTLADNITSNFNEMSEKVNSQIADQVKTATTTYTENNDRMLDAIVETNRKVVDFAVKTADRVADQAPSIPTLPVEIPFADRLQERFELPTPAEAGKAYIDVVERLVEMNRDFSERVVAMLPVQAAKPAAKKVATTPAAKKPAAKKTAAKKTAKKTTARKAAAKK
jgi:hypothetical protein